MLLYYFTVHLLSICYYFLTRLLPVKPVLYNYVKCIALCHITSFVFVSKDFGYNFWVVVIRLKADGRNRCPNYMNQVHRGISLQPLHKIRCSVG